MIVEAILLLLYSRGFGTEYPRDTSISIYGQPSSLGYQPRGGGLSIPSGRTKSPNRIPPSRYVLINLKH